MKRIILLLSAILFVLCLAACNQQVQSSPSELKITSVKTDKSLNPVSDSPKSDDNSTLKEETPATIQRDEITIVPVSEEKFVANLDVSILELIAHEIQTLVLEIQEKERADPEYVLQGKWNQDFRSSQQYSTVLALGLRAVKPAYYIIYKSGQSGLYEYILASAIDDITGYDYAVTKDYGWRNSKEFLDMYNKKVLQSLASFNKILEDRQLDEAEKAEQIRALGIFAVAPLLDEINSTAPRLSADILEICLFEIIECYSGEIPKLNMKDWRSENEQTFRDIIQIIE